MGVAPRSEQKAVEFFCACTESTIMRQLFWATCKDKDKVDRKTATSLLLCWLKKFFPGDPALLQATLDNLYVDRAQCTDHVVGDRCTHLRGIDGTLSERNGTPQAKIVNSMKLATLVSDECWAAWSGLRRMILSTSSITKHNTIANHTGKDQVRLPTEVAFSDTRRRFPDDLKRALAHGLSERKKAKTGHESARTYHDIKANLLIPWERQGEGSIETQRYAGLRLFGPESEIAKGNNVFGLLEDGSRIGKPAAEIYAYLLRRKDVALTHVAVPPRNCCAD